MLLAELENENWWNEGRRKVLYDMMESLIKKMENPRILDVGCGPGGTTISFSKLGILFGVDFSMLALKKAQEKGLENVVRSDLINIPIKKESFNIITALDVIEHVQDDNKVLLELKRILSPNGFLIITVPAFQFLWSGHDIALLHYRRYSKSTLATVLQDSGFEIIRMSYFVSFLFPLVALYRLLTKFLINKNEPKANEGNFPEFINNFFKQIMILENKLLKKIDLPFGLSLVCMAKKKYSES